MLKQTMKSKLILCLALVLNSIVFYAMPAGAQPGGTITYVSLEAKITQAATVLRGTITNLLRNIEPGYPNPTNFIIAVAVDEIIKGHINDKTVEITLPDWTHGESPGWREFEQLADQHASILLFLDDSGQLTVTNYPDFEKAVFLGMALPRGKVLVETNSLTLKQAFDFTGSPIYDMDLTILTKPEEILARSWTFARKQIETAKFHRFQLLNDNNVQWRSFCLLVPVEPALETIAKRLIAAPEDFISNNNARNDPAARVILRVDGVKALQYFKSDENIKLLKPLLNADCLPLNGAGFSYCEVRFSAYEVLTAWDVDVPKPVTEEKIQASQTNQ